MSHDHQADLRARLQRVERACDMQCAPGNWDACEYMRGMANGLILAVHIMHGGEGRPPYFDELPALPDEQPPAAAGDAGG